MKILRQKSFSVCFKTMDNDVPGGYIEDYLDFKSVCRQLIDADYKMHSRDYLLVDLARTCTRCFPFIADPEAREIISDRCFDIIRSYHSPEEFDQKIKELFNTVSKEVANTVTKPGSKKLGKDSQDL